MELIREYWWVAVVVVALVLAFILLRPKQRVQLTDSAPVRPHMVEQNRPPEGRGLTGEAAAATSDVTGAILGAPVHRLLDGVTEPQDDLCRIKGVGPKFAEALLNLGHVLMALGQEDEARSCWRRAIREKPELAQAYFEPPQVQ